MKETTVEESNSKEEVSGTDKLGPLLNLKFLGAGFIILVSSRYLISHVLSILLYISVIFLGLAWVSFKLFAVEAEQKLLMGNKSYCGKIPRLSFVDEIDWTLKAVAKKDDVQDTALFPESFLISEVIDNIIEYVLRDFVCSWFVKISEEDETFVIELKQQFQTAIQKLSQRLDNLDIPKLVILKLLPTITDHFNNFVVAEEMVKSKKNHIHDFDMAVASSFNKGHLHPAIKLKNLSLETDRQQYLQETIDSILPFLISQEEIASSPVRVLLKNILASCVAYPSISMLGESDFWNQLIVSTIGSVMNDRYKVKKFRSVLDHHSEETMIRNNGSYSRNHLMKYLLTTKSSEHSFEKILRNVSKSQSVSDLKQLRYYTSLQLSKSIRQVRQDSVIQDDVKQYNKRLQILKKSIDNKLEMFMDPSLSNLNDTPFAPSSIPKNSKLDLSLNDILTNSTSLPYFMEFMEQRSRTVLLQFWLTVNGIKSPLEDLDEYENLESDDEELIAMSMSLDLSQSGDIDQIFHQFFQEKMLKIDSVNYENVETFVNTERKTLDLYVRARKSILLLQKETFDRMDKTDLIAFKESDLFLRLLATEDLFGDTKIEMHNDLEEGGDPLINYDEEGELDEPSKVVGDNVIKAVEDALNEIMIDDKNAKSKSDISSRQSFASLSEVLGSDEGDGKKERQSPSELQRELFGLESEPSLFYAMESSAFDNGQKRNSKIFDDVSDSEADISETASNSEIDSSGQLTDFDNKEVQLAAPGDLNLEEEIATLTGEIDRYENQLSIIDPLLKKAEITNNVAELKILRRSKLSLEREIQQKELQRQQYIVQENDNSLFGKSRVRIQSYVPENNFVYYIIEVQKLSEENNEIVTAGWVVPRRFSQFYKLNEYLKLKYPAVQDVSFPKRKVVLKFQQTALIEERKNQLEKYLQTLLKIPEVCSNKLFRSFLSSDVFAMELNNSLDQSTKLSKRAKVEHVATKFYSSLSSRVPISGKNSPLGSYLYDRSLFVSPEKGNIMLQSSSTSLALDQDPVDDMQKELNSFDEVGKVPFVKPICDLIISLFSLKKSNAWLRGRAVPVVLQQILGSTIEKKVRDNLQLYFRTETKILDLIVILRDKLWPEGKFKESSKPRSVIEKSSTKSNSKMILERFFVSTASKIFGTSNSKFASNKIHAMLQNELILNDLIFSLYDDIIGEIFPEIVDA